MKFDLTHPCKDCPYRTDVVPYLKQDRAEEIIHEITENQKTFTCHKTTELDDRNRQHCAGALILLEKNNEPNQMMRIAERLRYYDRTKLKMSAPVFDTYQEFIDAQPE